MEYGTGDHNFCRYLSQIHPHSLLHSHYCLNLGRLITQTLGATSSLEIGRTVPSHFVRRSNLPPLPWPPLLVQLKTVSQPSKASTIEGLKAKLFQACWILKVLANTSHFRAPFCDIGGIFNLLFYLGATCVNWIANGKYHTGKYVTDFGTGDHNHCRWQYIRPKNPS